MGFYATERVKEKYFNGVKDRINSKRVDSETENIVIINQTLFKGWIVLGIFSLNLNSSFTISPPVKFYYI